MDWPVSRASTSYGMNAMQRTTLETTVMHTIIRDHPEWLQSPLPPTQQQPGQNWSTTAPLSMSNPWDHTAAFSPNIPVSGVLQGSSAQFPGICPSQTQLPPVRMPPAPTYGYGNNNRQGFYDNSPTIAYTDHEQSMQFDPKPYNRLDKRFSSTGNYTLNERHSATSHHNANSGQNMAQMETDSYGYYHPHQQQQSYTQHFPQSGIVSTSATAADLNSIPPLCPELCSPVGSNGRMFLSQSAEYNNYRARNQPQSSAKRHGRARNPFNNKKSSPKKQPKRQMSAQNIRPESMSLDEIVRANHQRKPTSASSASATKSQPSMPNRNGNPYRVQIRRAQKPIQQSQRHNLPPKQRLGAAVRAQNKYAFDLRNCIHENRPAPAPVQQRLGFGGIRRTGGGGKVQLRVNTQRRQMGAAKGRLTVLPQHQRQTHKYNQQRQRSHSYRHQHEQDQTMSSQSTEVDNAGDFSVHFGATGAGNNDGVLLEYDEQRETEQDKLLKVVCTNSPSRQSKIKINKPSSTISHTNANMDANKRKHKPIVFDLDTPAYRLPQDGASGRKTADSTSSSPRGAVPPYDAIVSPTDLNFTSPTNEQFDGTLQLHVETPQPSTSHSSSSEETTTASNNSGRTTSPSLSSSRTRSANNNDGDLGSSNTNPIKPLSRRVRLARSLDDALIDAHALSYFVHFLDSKDMSHLIKFWLHTESFRISTNQILAALHKRTALGNDQDRASGNGEPHSRSTVLKMLEQDAVNIFSKYIAKDAINSIETTQQIRDTVINRICSEHGEIDGDCFVPAQAFVYDVLKNRYFPEFQSSVYYCKHQLDVLQEGSVTVDDVLHNQNLLARFTEFLDRLKRRELVEFWLAAQSFRDNLTDVSRNGQSYDGELAQQDAMVLYDKFISMQSPTPIGFDDVTRIEIESNICRDGGPLPDCFDLAQKIVCNSMDKFYLSRFKKSPAYQQFVNELSHTIQTTPELPNAHRPRRTRHDSNSNGGASSDGCSSTALDYGRLRNTLLAQQSPARLRSATDSDCGSLGSSTTTAVDDVPLWERKPENFSLAHVDRLGRYVRDYEPGSEKGSPKKTVGTRLKSIMKKDDKDEDLIASQLADLIVSDIQQQCNGALPPTL